MLCNVNNIKPLLQTHKYAYQWSKNSRKRINDQDLEQIEINKNEGYEVAYFVALFMNKHHLNKVGHVYIIEDTLQKEELISIKNINRLVKKVEKILGLESIEL